MRSLSVCVSFHTVLCGTIGFIALRLAFIDQENIIKYLPWNAHRTFCSRLDVS